MRRPFIDTAVAAVVVVAAVAGCGGQEQRPGLAVSRPAKPLAHVWSPKPAKAAAPPTTTVRLPYPVDIPDDPYAPEPVTQIGILEIPRIGLTHPLYDGVTLHNIDKGPSHWPGTALPGRLGNAVIAGHRTTQDHPFERIGELVPGDQVIFTVNGTRITYVVSSHLVVKPSDTWIADQTQAYTATLYACHPPGSVDERYVVRMQLAA